MLTKFIYPFSILLLISNLAVAQQAPAQPPPTVKHVPISNTSPSSGKDMFNNYCAVCHGTDGKGTGPAATALKATPADLTALAQKNGGKYQFIIDSITHAAMPQDQDFWNFLISSSVQEWGLNTSAQHMR